MTMPRPLPRSLDPLTNESIIGYVLRLAHRLDLTPARVAVITGLHTDHRSTSTSPLGLAVHVTPTARDAFAHATRLTETETANLFLDTLGDRYPAAQTTRGWRNRWGNTNHHDQHVFAPHPIRDQLPPTQWSAWRISDYAFWARQQHRSGRAHDTGLRRLLDAYAVRLATHIDLTGHAVHDAWTDPLADLH